MTLTPRTPAPAAVPEREPVAEPESVPEQTAESAPEPQAETVREPAAEAAPEPAADLTEPHREAAEAVQGDPAGLPRLRAVPVEPPTGSRGDDESTAGPAPAAAGRPRFGTVSVPEPSRVPPARRRDLPAVRAVRLTDEPPAPADRPAPAAVTPVPLPVPRAVPTESRTEEPQP
ncbi:hypothetical protein [Streptomyces sp. NPDC004284]|uniref:hypothetical protein n=1 Tax=Streptomyces sp. NPDC004284 TaxID=3364695 RepID=UPI0036BE1E29